MGVDHHKVVKRILDRDVDEKGRGKDKCKTDRRNWYNDPWGTGFASDRQE